MEKKRKIVPPVYFLVTLIAMTALNFRVPVLKYLEPPVSLIGVALIGGGTLVSAWAAGAFVRAGTPVVPFAPSNVLVASGLYRLTRNPMYLGMVIALLGVAVLFGTIGALLPVPLFVWIIHTQFVLGEERFLESIFGEEYLAYKKSVRRWI